MSHLCASEGLDSDLLISAFELKRLAGQINVVIHAAGILAALPGILDEGERIEYLSLGAGNTGRNFDLETNQRVAEFKFINWRGGAESIARIPCSRIFTPWLSTIRKSAVACTYLASRSPSSS